MQQGAMVMIVLSNCLDMVCKRWLGSSIACCVSHDSHEEDHQLDSRTLLELLMVFR